VDDVAQMDRRHDFVVGLDPAALPWRPLALDGLPAGAEAKLLSRDADGRSSQLVRLPQGWRAAGHLRGETELLVLDGELDLGGRPAGRYTYAALTAGSALALSAPRPTELLLFVNQPWGLTGAAPPPVAAGLVAPVSLYDLPWTAPSTPGLPPGMLIKRLRDHPVTGARTWVMGLQLWPGLGRWEVHPVAEEMVVLDGAIDNGESLPEGEVLFSYGRLGYFHRPAGICHGGPRAGVADHALLLFRTPGPLTTTFFDEPCPYPQQYLDAGKAR
jgi:hypothetical protein